MVSGMRKKIERCRKTGKLSFLDASEAQRWMEKTSQRNGRI